MKPSEVKVGDRFGHLVVQSIQQHYRNGKKEGKEAICLCDCGNEKIVKLGNLQCSHTVSCGCRNKTMAVKNLVLARESLQSSPEIMQDNGRRNIVYANEFLKGNPEVRNGIVKRAKSALSDEVRRENGRKTGSLNITEYNRKVREGLESIRDRALSQETCLQKQYRELLEKEGFQVEREFFLEGHYFDFKVNNFLIEINGDIYHSSKYENLLNPLASGPSIKYKPDSYHKSLYDLANCNGYHLIQLWEHKSQSFNKSLLLSQLQGEVNISEYVEYISNQKVICNDYGFQTKGSYLPDPGKWISTASHEIVSPSYEKGKVLVFNSGYTILED